MILVHVHDETSSPPVSRPLPGGWTAVALPLNALARHAAPSIPDCLFDVDLKVLAKALEIRTFVSGAPKLGARIFAGRRGDRHAAIQAAALGATALVERPISDAILGELLSTAGRAGDDGAPSSTVTGAIAIAHAFGALNEGAGLSARYFGGVASGIGQDIAAHGVAPWLSAIRHHHLGTYQHCLTVTGLAAGFGRELGLSARDAADLTTAALLHDIGKARISLEVLDKPGRLDSRETALVRMHPVWGDEYLRTHSDVSPVIRAGVRHHHEYLDGSGYPDGLSGRQIGDMTRLLTVADIFAALIERRAYKAPATPRSAMATLRAMAAAGRLEAALVEAFAPVAALLPASGTESDEDDVRRASAG